MASTMNKNFSHPEVFDHGQPIESPGPVLAEQISYVLQAIDRRYEDFRRDQAIARSDHLDAIRTMLNEHRCDVLSNIAKLMQPNTG